MAMRPSQTQGSRGYSLRYIPHGYDAPQPVSPDAFFNVWQMSVPKGGVSLRLTHPSSSFTTLPVFKGPLLDFKPDLFPLFLRWGHQGTNGIEDHPELLVIFLLQGNQPLLKVLVCGHDLPEPDERPHDFNIDPDRALAFQDA